MASSTEKIRDSFPFLTVEPIVGEPTYESVKALHQKLNTNAASVRSHLGNGRLGLLYLTVTPEVYNTLSEVEFVPPQNPGPTVQYPDNATQYQIQAANKTHETATKLFNEYDACDRALKQLLIGAVDDIFINALCDRHVGYANVSTLNLLTHLYNTYGKITEVDLNRNHELMSEAFDPNLPIESFFRRIEECVEFAAAGNTPFSPQQVVTQAFYNIQRSGLFTDDCRFRMYSKVHFWKYPAHKQSSMLTPPSHLTWWNPYAVKFQGRIMHSGDTSRSKSTFHFSSNAQQSIIITRYFLW